MSARSPARSPDAHAWATGHDVQFYDSEASLAGFVGQFLSDGIRMGQPIIVIATASHRREFQTQLRSRGIDPDELYATDAVWLDAQDTLSAFMEGGHPNPDLFAVTVGNVFESVMAKRKYALVRAYGEMVDILWREGKSNAALELEELWNGLASKYSFSLLCTYSKESLMAHVRNDAIEKICGCHTRFLSKPL